MMRSFCFVAVAAIFLGVYITDLSAREVSEQCSDRDTYPAQERIAACNSLLEHSPNDLSQRVAALYNLGIAKYDNKDLPGAIQTFTSAIRADSAYVPAYVNRGIAERDIGQYELAMQDYTHAIGLDPNDARAFGNRANLYVLQKAYDLALNDYGRAIDLDPANERTRINRGTLYDLMQKDDMALADYSEVAHIDPKNADALNGKCFVLAKQRRFVAALADCNAALAINDKDPEIWDSKGLVELLAGKYDDAELSYSRALQMDPRLTTALYGRGIVKLKLHDKSGYSDINGAKHIAPSVDVEMARRGISIK